MDENQDIGEPYGLCECGEPLEPVYFTEKEYEIIGGTRHFTGRTRCAVSHLLCPGCGREVPVDDTFDGLYN